MSNNSEIPCQNCHQWNSKGKNFSCSPYKCKKLSEWLLDNAQLGNTDNEQVKAKVPEAQIQYIS